MAYTLRGGSVTDDLRMDRLVSFDEASRQYPVRALLTPGKIRAPRSYTWTMPAPAPMDQGQEGSCVAHGWAHELMAAPRRVTGIASPQVMGWYRRMQAIDEFPDTEGEGTSILAGAKIMQEAGFVSAYHWAFTEAEMAAAVAWLGPVVIGVWWFDGMREPDADGWIRPTGRRVGGHCVCVPGISVSGGYYRIINSWGSSWGPRGGWARMSRKDMAALLAIQGEVCLPVRTERRAV